MKLLKFVRVCTFILVIQQIIKVYDTIIFMILVINKI